MAAGHHRGQVLGGHLDAGGVAVVADPELAEAQRPEARLGLGHRSQGAQGDRGAVGDAGGQAGGGRLVPGAQAQLPRPLPHVGLGEPGLHQREAGPGLGGGLLAGPVVAQVVEVDAEHHGGGPRVARTGVTAHARRSQGDQSLHQRGLAVEAAGAVVGRVGRVGQLVGLHLGERQPPLGGQGAAVGQLLGGQGRGHGRDAADLVGTQGVGGHPGQEGRVGPAAEGHHHRARPLQPGPQPSRSPPTGARSSGSSRSSHSSRLSHLPIIRGHLGQHLLDRCRPCR